MIRVAGEWLLGSLVQVGLGLVLTAALHQLDLGLARHGLLDYGGALVLLGLWALGTYDLGRGLVLRMREDGR